LPITATEDIRDAGMLLYTGMHCTECGYNCHEKCVQNVPKNCTRLRPAASQLASLTSTAPHSTAGAGVQQSAAQCGTDATLVGSPVTQSSAPTSAGSLCLSSQRFVM